MFHRLVRAALLAACRGGFSAAAQPVPPERILRMAPNADLQTLDPINTTAGVVQSHARMIYDQLFGRDAQQRPQPQMVASWTVSDDALTWSFTLRDGLKFHGGAPVTAADVTPRCAAGGRATRMAGRSWRSPPRWSPRRMAGPSPGVCAGLTG